MQTAVLKERKTSQHPRCSHRPASCPICLPNQDGRTSKAEALPPVTAETAETESHKPSDPHVTTATRHCLPLRQEKRLHAGKPVCCHWRTQPLRRPPASRGPRAEPPGTGAAQLPMATQSQTHAARTHDPGPSPSSECPCVCPFEMGPVLPHSSSSLAARTG